MCMHRGISFQPLGWFGNGQEHGLIKVTSLADKVAKLGSELAGM